MCTKNNTTKINETPVLVTVAMNGRCRHIQWKTCAGVSSSVNSQTCVYVCTLYVRKLAQVQAKCKLNQIKNKRSKNDAEVRNAKYKRNKESAQFTFCHFHFHVNKYMRSSLRFAFHSFICVNLHAAHTYSCLNTRTKAQDSSDDRVLSSCARLFLHVQVRIDIRFTGMGKCFAIHLNRA